MPGMLAAWAVFSTFPIWDVFFPACPSQRVRGLYCSWDDVWRIDGYGTHLPVS